MRCPHYDAGECRSCTLMGTPYEQQLADLDAHVREVLADVVPHDVWDAPVVGPESAFRNKAKLVVGGTKGAPTFGILDADRRGVSLPECGLYEPRLAAALDGLLPAVAELGLTPFDVPGRQGELKHLIVTGSPDGELMARFVLRSPGQMGRVERGLDLLRKAAPGLRVVSVNLQPEHKAVLEGEEEVVLTPADTLPMRVGEIVFHLRPRSFFQTNTTVTTALYGQARDWVGLIDPGSVLDLYCGVGASRSTLPWRPVASGASRVSRSPPMRCAARAGRRASSASTSTSRWVTRAPSTRSTTTSSSSTRRVAGSGRTCAAPSRLPDRTTSSTPAAMPRASPVTWQRSRATRCGRHVSSTCFPRRATTRSSSCSSAPERAQGLVPMIATRPRMKTTYPTTSSTMKPRSAVPTMPTRRPMTAWSRLVHPISGWASISSRAFEPMIQPMMPRPGTMVRPMMLSTRDVVALPCDRGIGGYEGGGSWGVVMVPPP